MKHFTIMVRETGRNHERELCSVDSNPEAIVEAAKTKVMAVEQGGRKVKIPAYEHVYFKDNLA